MHPSLSVDRSIVRESPKLLKESGRQKKEGKGRQGPLLCVVLCCASLASSSASNPLETANQKKKVKKKKEEGKKLVFFVFPAHFFFSSWVRRGQNTRCLLLFGFIFFLASSGFSVPCQTVVARSHSW
jgi:hypothetical protein